MSLPMHKKEGRYESMESAHDIDLENDSDTTLASTGFLTKKGEKRSRHGRSSSSSKGDNVFVWARWGTVLALQSVIIFLLLRTKTSSEAWPETGESGTWKQIDTETGGDINGLYVPRSHKYQLLTPEMDKFVPNMTNDDNRMEVRANWDMLMPLGSGTVKIPDYKQHPMLGKPIDDDPIRTGPVFEASWTHALHCLYYTVDSYHQMVISNATKFGFDGERNDKHANHCFEYLRTQLLCMADMTLEGSQSVLDATGKAQAHMCRNMDEAKAWIEERRVDDIQSIVGP